MPKSVDNKFSCKKDQLKSAELSTYNWPTNCDLLVTTSRSRAELFWFYHIENEEKVIVSFKFSQLSATA